MILTLTDQLDTIDFECVSNGDTSLRTLAKDRLNIYQDEILSSKDYKFTEGFYSFTSVADQQNYDFAINHKKVKTVVPTISSTRYPALVEITDPNEWEYLNANYTATSNFPTHFHVLNRQIYIFPKPSSADISFSVVYTKRAKPMNYEDYLTGSIAVTNGSKSVIGTGTSWLANAEAGAKLKIGNNWYDVAGITTNTALTLVQSFQGSSASGLSYILGDTSLIHEDFQSILWNRFCYEFYRRNNPDRAKDFFAEMARLKTDMDSYVSAVNTSRVIELDSRPRYKNYPTTSNTIFN
jgi:hypothetical protein